MDGRYRPIIFFAINLVLIFIFYLPHLNAEETGQDVTNGEHLETQTDGTDDKDIEDVSEYKEDELPDMSENLQFLYSEILLLKIMLESPSLL